MSGVLALIPARGGSKGVPRKNVRPVCGKPLIGYTIDVALACRDLFHRVVVSTDDDEIATLSRGFGADVPFIRPSDLGGDRVPMIPVVEHAIRTVEALDGVRLDWVMLLQPTDPLRDPADLRHALELARGGDCDSVISVVQVFDVHPILMKRIEGDRLLPYCIEEIEGTRRQDYSPPAYMRNGAIYLSRRDVVLEQRSLWGRVIRPYVMPPERSVGVDSEIDLKLVELLLRERQGSQVESS